MAWLDQYRKVNPWATDYSDAELIQYEADNLGMDPAQLASRVGYDIPKSNAGKSWSSGVDQYQAGLWDVAGALGSDYARRQAEKNRAEAALVDSTNDAVKSFEDVHSLGDFGSFVKHGAIQSAPYLMEAVGAGLTGGGTAVARGIGQAGLRTLGRGAVEREAAELIARNASMGAIEAERLAAENVAKGYARSAAAGIGSYPSSVGAVLGRQVEETGQYDPATAFALGVPYAALNTVGLEGQMLRGMPRGLSASALKRAGVGFAEGAIPEGGAEMAQSFLERTGAGLDPFGPGSAREYIDSGILGSVLGGVPGSVSAGVRGPAINREQQVDLLSQGRTRDETFGQAGIDTRSAIYNGDTAAQGQMYDLFGAGPGYAPTYSEVSPVAPRGYNPNQLELGVSDLFGNPVLQPNAAPAQQQQFSNAGDQQTLDMFYPNGQPTYAADGARNSAGNIAAFMPERTTTDQRVPVKMGRNWDIQRNAAGLFSNTPTLGHPQGQFDPNQWVNPGNPNAQLEVPGAPSQLDQQLAQLRAFRQNVAQQQEEFARIKAKQAAGQMLTPYEHAFLRGGEPNTADAPTVDQPTGEASLVVPDTNRNGIVNGKLALTPQVNAATTRTAIEQAARAWVASRGRLGIAQADFEELINELESGSGKNWKKMSERLQEVLAANDKLSEKVQRDIGADPKKVEDAAADALAAKLKSNGGKMVMSIGDVLASGIPLSRLSIHPTTHKGGEIKTSYATRMSKYGPSDTVMVTGVKGSKAVGQVGSKPNSKANISYLGRLLAANKDPQVVQMARDALKGMAVKAIAAKYGVSDGTVSNRLGKLGLSIKEGDFDAFKREHDLGDTVSYAELFGENASAEEAGLTISNSPSDSHVKEDSKTSKETALSDDWMNNTDVGNAELQGQLVDLQNELQEAIDSGASAKKKQSIKAEIKRVERMMKDAGVRDEARAEQEKKAAEARRFKAEEEAKRIERRRDSIAALTPLVEQEAAADAARLETERKWQSMNEPAFGVTERGITDEDWDIARDEYNDVLEMVARDGGENLPTWKELTDAERRRVVMATMQYAADRRAASNATLAKDLKPIHDKMRASITEVVNGQEATGTSQRVAEGAAEGAANEVSPTGQGNEAEGSRDAGNDTAGENGSAVQGAWKGLENLQALISKARLDELRKLGLPTQLMNQIAGIARTQKEPLKFFDATIKTYSDFELEVQEAKRSAPENAANVVDRGWKDVHEAIDGSKTLGEALTKLLNFPHTAKWQKVLINALLKSNGVRQSALVLNPNFVLSKTIANGVALGNYVPDTNVTILHAGGGLQSLLHEAIHAAIYNKMDNDQAFAFQIQKLYTKAKKALGEGHYGLTDIQEFVAEAFTNPEFQKALAGIPSTNTGSVWQAFVDAVRAALKLFGIQRNLLDDVISVASIHIADESVAPAQQGTQRVAPERAVLGVEIPAPAARYGTQLGRYLKSKVSNLGMSVMFGHDLQAYAEKYLPGEVSKYFKAVWDKFNERSRLELMVQKVGEAFHRLDMPQRKRVIDFMRTSRLEGKWGFNPEFLPADKDGKRPEVDTEMAKLYEALGSDEAKAVVQSVFAVGHKMLKEHEMALLERIEGVEEDIKRLTKEPESEQERTELTKELNALKTAKNTKLKEMQTPYVPLFREGSHIVTMKSQELLAAEKAYKEALNGDGVAAETTKDLREEYMKLRKDASHYRMYMRDDWEATGLQLDLEKEFPKAQVTMRAAEKEYQQLTELPRQMMERVASMLEADDKGSRSVRKEINQMYLNYLNQDHPLKHQMKAEGIAGFDEDMMRGFLKSGRKQAAMIASIRTQRTMMDALYSIRRAARDDTTGNAKIKMDIANKITQRYLAASEFRETPIQDWLMRNNSLFMLLFSPAYYFQNATQPFTTSAPIMAGRFGSAAYTKLWAAYRDDVPALLKSKFSLDTLKGDEQRMAKELEMRSHLDFGSDIELGELAERKSLSDNKVSEYWRDGNNFLRNSVQRVEKINRLTTALAAYRLMKEELTKKGGLSAEEIHQQATNYADQVIVDTHGDYSGANAPLFMTQGNKTLPVKVMTQFKKFQLIQLSLLFKTAKDALVNADPKQKAIARRSLLHMGTVYGTLAGAAGLPAFSLMAPLLAATLSGLSDDDDDKQGKHEDSVAYLRRMARKAGASEFATTALFKGLPAAVGWDMSNMVGMGKVLDPLPYTDSGKTTKDTLTNYLWGLAGPVGTRAQKIATAFDLAQEGQYWKAAEQVVPSGFSNAMQGYRIGTEGVTDRKGDVLYSPDEVGTVSAVMKAAGFAPSMVTDRSWRASIKSQTEEAFNRDSTAVRREAEAAFRENDPAKIDEARQAFVELQRERQQMGFKPQTLKDFYNIRKDMAKRERNVAGGIEFTKGNEKFVKRLADT